MKSEILTMAGRYPLWNNPRKLFRWTGEKRPPKKGEYYLSGAIIEAYRSSCDSTNEQAIALPAGKRTGYVKPSECGLASSAHAVGRRLADILNTMGRINQWILNPCGALKDCENFRYALRDKLRMAGWRVTVDQNDKWRVLPPRKPDYE